jgi:hypothetical protein
LKKILLVVGVLAVLAVAGLVVLFRNLDVLVERGVERFGSDATQTKVELDSAEVSLQTGEGRLNGLTVGNPSGFETDEAFTMDRIQVHVDPATVRSDTVVVKEVVVVAPKITYEMDKGLRANLRVIQDHVNAYAQRFASGAETTDEPGTRIRIERFRVEGGTVTLVAPLKGQSRTEKLPDFEVRDLGVGGGDTVEAVTAKLFEVMTQKAIEAAVRGGFEQKANELLEGAMDKAADALGGLLGGKRDGDAQPDEEPAAPRPRKKRQ